MIVLDPEQDDWRRCSVLSGLIRTECIGNELERSSELLDDDHYYFLIFYTE